MQDKRAQMELKLLNQLICIALIGILSGISEQSHADVPALSKSITTVLQTLIETNDESFTDEQLAAITELSLNETHNIDLAGLSRLSGLKKLSLRDNALSDLGPISTLTSLTHLTLNDNRISDLTPLSSLTNLTTLNLSNNLIIDCSPLSKLSKLHTLTMNENAIENLRPLKNLAHLHTLQLGENRITTLDGIQSLKALTDFQVPGNSITNFNELANLKSLRKLNISGNRIDQLAPLNGLTNLKSLRVERNPIRSIAPLAKLSALTHFSMSSSRFDGNLSPISKLHNLTDFSCTHSHLNNITPLKNTKSLTLLNLQGNDIDEIRGLIESSSPFKKIDLTNNPLGILARSFHISALREKASVSIDGRVFDSSSLLVSDFKNVDTNSNGELSFKEAKEFVAKLELDEFDALDTNHDFVITVKELAALRVILPNSMALVWVGNNSSDMPLGTRTSPFNSLEKASYALKDGGTIILAPGTTLRGTTFSEPMRLTVPDDAEKPGRIIGVQTPIESKKDEN